MGRQHAAIIFLRTVTVNTASASGMAIDIAAHWCVRNNQSRIRGLQLQYHLWALLHPISSITTAWRKLLSCGSSSDFIVTVGFNRYDMLEVLLSIF